MAFNLDPDKIDLTNLAHVHEIIIEMESEANLRRKREAFKAFECLEGRQKDHVIDKLKYLYPESWQKFRVGNVNIVKKIIKKKSKAYKNSPMRKLDRDNETEELNAIYDKFKFSRAFKEADKIYNLHKYVCLYLRYLDPAENSDDLKGTYHLQALAPYEYDLITNEHGKPVIFAFSYPDTDVTKGDDGIEQTIKEDQRDSSAESKKYVIWSAKDKIKVVTRGKRGGRPDVQKIEAMPNKIGRLPIAFLSQDTAEDYPIPTDLHTKAIDWCAEFSDLKTAASAQGHGQLVVSHPESMAIRQLHMGMHTAINLPQSRKENDKPTTAEYISASPDLMGQLSVLKFSLLQILDDEGITSSSAIEGGVNEVKSGFDRLLKEADVQDIVQDNQELYADCLEQDVYLTLAAYEDALNQLNFTSDKLDVTFEKPKVLITDKEVLENLEKREQLGLMLSHEKHMVINPNLDDEAAKAREEEIQLQKEEKADRMRKLLGNESEEPEEDEEESEENAE